MNKYQKEYIELKKQYEESDGNPDLHTKIGVKTNKMW